MLLTIDLGNTSLKLGIWENTKCLFFLTTDSKHEDYGALIKNFLYRNALSERNIDDAIVSSVVPNLNQKLYEGIYKITNKQPITINPRNSYGIGIDTPNIDEVGSDILVMCAAGYEKFQKELLVVSIGTATVISHVSSDGVFKHCVIAPGYEKIAESLYGNAAKLPEFDIKRCTNFLANTTVSAMNVGLYQGYIGSLRYLIAGMKAELKRNPQVIACGGYGKEVVSDIKEISYYEPDLVSYGLAMIYNKYIKK